MTTHATTRADHEAAARTATEQREHERREVAKHYEHDADVFQLVLDRRLGYAAAVFHAATEDLETAQKRKYEWVRSMLDIQPGERVLDVGCGWGSNLLFLAEATRGIFHGVTLSERQCQFTLARANELGVADRVRIDVCHVEDLALEPESVDAVLFVGSIVHMRNREEIHRLVARALRPGGRLLISDCYFPRQTRGDRSSAATDYIFIEALGYCRLLGLADELALIEEGGLDVLHVEELTACYALTLARWIDNVRAHRARIEELAPGFSEVLQCYMTIAKMSFDRRTALEYMILACKGVPRGRLASPLRRVTA
jgi:cyclopropane-fatty-acyl-phospholipid synthase